MSDGKTILFTAVGRRVELLQAFRAAASTVGVPLKIVGADVDPTAPALAWCDRTHQVCPISEDGYVPQLLDICRREGVDLVIPTIDTDLMELATSRELFLAEGAEVLACDADKVMICRDKRKTVALFDACGLCSPKVWGDYASYDGPYPCFVKPCDGSSSANAYRADNPGQLEAFASKAGEYMIQSFVDGREYTIDVFCDFDGELLSAVPRERLRVRSGEVQKTRVCLDERMLEEVSRLVGRLRPRGPLAVQLIRERGTGTDWFIEVNPRFGGGAPLSMRAGAGSAELLLRLLAGERPAPTSPDAVADGMTYSRFDQCVPAFGTSRGHVVRGVIFDLDDTLYPEREYVRSGFRAVASHLGRPEAEGELWELFLAKEPSIDAYVAKHGCPEAKDELLEVYRSHRPDISLFAGAAELLGWLSSHGIKTGVITDGRVGGQRQKIDSLGLGRLVDDILITDELGGPQFRKPCDIAFRIMQHRWQIPCEQLVYVGDNPRKDFIAPGQLGIRGVQLVSEGSIHGAFDETVAPACPRVGSMRELADVLSRMTGVDMPHGEKRGEASDGRS